MDSMMIKNIIEYHIVAEKLNELCQTGKISAACMKKAKQYICRKYMLQTELLDSFLD